MDKPTKLTRREVLKVGGIAVAAVPIAGFIGNAFATQNASIRAALKYQDHPNGDKDCIGCVNFVPNKDKPNDPGPIHGCKLYAGDTEISPKGYCVGYVAKPKK